MSIKKITPVHKIYDALKKHYNLKTDKQLSEFIDVDYNLLMQWKRRGEIVRLDSFLIKCTGVNPVWLRTGEGEMFMPSTPPILTQGVIFASTHKELTSEEAEAVRIMRDCPELLNVIRLWKLMDADTQKDIRRCIQKEILLQDLLKERYGTKISLKGNLEDALHNID
jgi:hypothetical protein